MSPDLSEKLVADFPELFLDTSMAWGFECSDGWERLIRDMAAQLTFLTKISGIRFTATQVKEKFGTLRFYYVTECNENPSPDEDVAWTLAYAAVVAAEQRSAHTCEACGDRGSTRSNGWIRTLCAQHAYEQKYPLHDWEAKRLGVADHVPQKDTK